MKILGLHHITLVTNNAQHNVDFYVGVLGLRFIKKTVNFDDPSAYHLYYGDHDGTPGSAVTFFEWRDARKGRPGIGGTQHFALTVADENGLLKWKRRLTDLGIAVLGPYDRQYFKSIYFNDPDGTIVEIATKGPGMTVDEPAESLGETHQPVPEALQRANRDDEAIAATTWPEPVPLITDDMALKFGMHHISAFSSDVQATHVFLSGVLGLRRVKMTDNYDYPGMPHWYWGVDDGQPGTLITYFGHTPGRGKYVVPGAGQTHHFAFAVKDEEEQELWREKLMQNGYRVSPIMNRDYFRSIYTNDPDGHIVELATLGPGFDVDEPLAELGSALKLPEWLEQHRSQIERSLVPIQIPERPVEA
ncbi:MAG: glyoxalase [Anaerolineaceae bacterium]|nr:glyoxalase [Anaerolineaceae bacterium]